jgi:hypothetical protein
MHFCFSVIEKEAIFCDTSHFRTIFLGMRLRMIGQSGVKVRSEGRDHDQLSAGQQVIAGRGLTVLNPQFRASCVAEHSGWTSE